MAKVHHGQAEVTPSSRWQSRFDSCKLRQRGRMEAAAPSTPVRKRQLASADVERTPSKARCVSLQQTPRSEAVCA